MRASLCAFAHAYLKKEVAELCGGADAPRENAAVKRAAPDAREGDAVRRFNKYDAVLYELATAEFRRRGAGGLPHG